MQLNSFVRASLAIGLALIGLAASANATTIIYSTDVAGTGFGGTSLMLANSLGAAATLTFIPNANVATGVPSNINLGNFTLVCPLCSTQSLGAGSYFSAFTFDLVITDVTDGGAGKFVGTSAGGLLYSDVSQISISWTPAQLGPGTNNASSGSFQSTFFTPTPVTAIVAPNSGAVPGQTTVQGFIGSTAVPEPATLLLFGSALVGIGLLRRASFRKP